MLNLISKLKNNLLHAIDYNQVQIIRRNNYVFLHEELHDKNKLKLTNNPGSYMYPFFLMNGAKVRKELQKHNVFVPILWPDVLGRCKKSDIEYQMAENILPLPIDQRYGTNEMIQLLEVLKQCMKN